MADIFDTLEAAPAKDIFDEVEQPQPVAPAPEAIDRALRRQSDLLEPSGLTSTTVGGPAKIVAPGDPFLPLRDKSGFDIAYAPLDVEPRMNLAGLVPEVSPQESWKTAALKEVTRSAASLPDFFTSDAGVTTALLSMVPALRPIIGAYWAQDLLRGAYKQAMDATDNWGQLTEAQKAQAIVNVSLGTAFGLASAGLGMGPRLRTVSPAALGETVRRIPPGAEGAATAIKVLEQAKTAQKEMPGVPPPVVPPQEKQPTPAAEAVTAAGEAPAKVTAAAMEAGRAAPAVASAEASARAQGAVEAGRERVEAAPEQPAAPTPQPKETDASKISETTTVHGDVRPFVEPPGTVPLEKGGAGVQPPPEGGIPKTEAPARPAGEGVLLRKPTAKDYRDRNLFPGEHYAANPNSIIVQIRGLDTIPIGSGKPLVFPFTGDLSEAGRIIYEKAIPKLNQLGGSKRESIFKATDENGRAIYHFQYNAAEGKVSVTTQAELDYAREQYRAMTAAAEATPTTVDVQAEVVKDPLQLKAPEPAAEEGVLLSPDQAKWEKLYEDLSDNLDAFNPARDTGVRNYELDDMAQRFVEFAQADKSGKPLSELVNDFAKTDQASKSQIKKLKAAVKGVEPEQEKPTQPTPPEPAKGVVGWSVFQNGEPYGHFKNERQAKMVASGLSGNVEIRPVSAADIAEVKRLQEQDKFKTEPEIKFEPSEDVRDAISVAGTLAKRKDIPSAEKQKLGALIESARQGTPGPLKQEIDRLRRAFPRTIQRKQVTRLFDRETQAIGTDILDWLSDNMRLMSKSAARKAMGEKFKRNKGEWDDAPILPIHHNERVYGGTARPDQAAQAAYEARIIKEPSVTELWAAIGRASERRKGALKKQAAELKSLETDIEFREKATTPEEGTIEQPASELQVGDSFEIEGQPFLVTRIESDGTVILKDGTRWGTQKIESGETIYVEKFEPVKTESFQLEKPESVEEQKARLAREAEERKAKEEKAKVAEKAAAPLEGGTGDLGQRDMLGGGDLFSEAKPTPPGPGLSGSVGAAAATSHIRAGEAPPEFYEGTSLKNAVADVERASYGLPEATPAEKRKMAERWIDSGSILQKDPAAGVNIVQRLKANPETGLSDTESALVLREKVRLENALNAAAERTFRETDPALKAQAQGEWDAASQSLLELLNAAKSRGSSWGREGRWRQAVAYADMSFASMERQMRMNRGGAELTMDERTKLKALADQYKATEEKLRAELSDANERNRRLDEAVAELNRKVQAQPRFDQKVLDYAESIVSRMENAADKARERILARRREGRLYAGIDVEQMADYAVIGASKIARGLNEFAVWSDAMVKYLGDWITGDLQQIWEASQKQYAATLRTAPDPVQKALKTMTPDAKIEAWGKQIEKRLSKRENADVHVLIQKIGRALIERGVRTRDALVDGVYALTQKFAPKMTRDEVMDAISGYGDFSPLTKDAVSVIYRDLKGQLQQVGKLRDMAAGRAPKRSGPERHIPSDEERRQQQQVEEAKRRGGYRVTDPETQLKTAMDAVKTRLENQISDIEEQIRTRTKIVKQRTRLEYDDQANALKARRDELKAVFDEIFPKEPITEAERLARWERHLDRRIADYEERIKNRDFAKRERKPLPAPRAETLARMDKLEQLREQLHEMILRDKYKRMKLHQKIWVGVKEALNIPRNVMASADVSAVLRQGGMLSASHPITAARALVPMFKGMASERLAGIVDQEIMNRPNAKSGRYAQAKLYLAPLRSTSLSAMEEQIMSRFAHHIPIVRASNRAFITFLNRIRADSFDLLVENLEKRGRTLTVDETKAIANYINISTGRGDMGRFTAGAEGLATVFFAPRLVTSRFQLLAGQPLWRGTATTRKAIAAEYARSLASLGVITTLGIMAGATVESDPRSAEFGKLRFGNTRVDPMAGLSQTAVLVSRTAVAAANRLAKWILGRNLTQGEIKTAGGKIKMLGATNLRYGERSYADIATTFLRQKLSPVVGGFIDVLTEKNLGGEPVTPGSELATLVTPLSFQDIFNVMREQGISKGTAFLMLSLFGMGLQYYDPKQKAKRPPLPPLYP